MTWIESALETLDDGTPSGYRVGSRPSSEPTSLAALALAAHGRSANADRLLGWLAARQLPDGRVALDEVEAGPGWVTPLAAVAWVAGGNGEFAGEVTRALHWIENVPCAAAPKSDTDRKAVSAVGHDPSLIAWPWVPGTHSWVIPSSYCVLALKATGRGDRPRVREAVRMLVDRLLTNGGCNYGNPIVLGRELRPQIEPTGAALAALRGEPLHDPRLARSLDYLNIATEGVHAPASLCFGLTGLAAWDRIPHDALERLSQAHARLTERRRQASRYQLALLTLASLGRANPLIATMPRSL